EDGIRDGHVTGVQTCALPISKKPEALCQIVNGPRFTSEAEFWSGLMKAQLVHLADGDGKPIAPEQLPRTLDAMSDDPYRSLAWQIGRASCRERDKSEVVAR